ncbi:hypothetical protein GKC56_05900 [Neisseriaceae bacterium PsAf]|nr:hypothetical protein [Neisseriaceae bacterium PsAf]
MKKYWYAAITLMMLANITFASESISANPVSASIENSISNIVVETIRYIWYLLSTPNVIFPAN